MIITQERSEDLLSSWSVCLRIHANFYDVFMTKDEVRIALKIAEGFMKKSLV